jgi:tol-pal system protein YbgF
LNLLSLKPALLAGFSLLVVPLIAPAQEYIDVEAEREQQSGPVEIVTRDDSSLVSSNGSTAAPSAVAQEYNVAGVRPYSGQTTQAVPVSSASNPDTSVGSVVVQLQLLQEEVRRLNGLVEEQAQQLTRLKEQSLERYVDLDRRVAALGAVPSTAGEPTPSVAGPTTDSSVAANVSSAAKEPGEEVAYQSAYQLVKTRQFAQAVEAFKGFLGDYPFGHFAPNAHYWLGELYLVLDTPDPELARQSFQLLLDQYPNNAKVPDAIYKLGRVHFLKGNRDRARSYLSRVTSEYPDHPAAQLAQDFIRDNF